MNNEKKHKKNRLENGRIKNTSAFNIKQAEELNEISWSNNKFESTYTCKEEASNHS